MRKIAIAFLFLFLVSSAISVRAQLDDQIAEYEVFVKQQMETDSVPGLSLGFMKDGKIWANGYGYADLENRSPAKAQTMYRLASVTKPMTAMAVLKLVDERKIDLDAEVQKYVPYFPKKKYPVTVRLLLGHLGGISHYKNYDLEGHFKNYKDTKQSLEVFQDWELIAEPGTRYNYSSYGYNLLGAVIEGASGLPYAKYMSENIWKPLGMETIRMDSLEDVIPNRTRGYAYENGMLRNSETVDISSRFAAGGTRATVTDMLRFGKGIIDGKVISNESLALMTESMATKNGEMTNYSAGLGTYPINGRFTLSHSGGQAETSTHLFIFPSRDLVIAVAVNLEGASIMPYAARLFEMLTGEAWDINAYVADGEKMPLYLAMQAVFEQGRAAFEKSGGSEFSDNPETTTAFSHFNKYLNPETLISAKRDELANLISSTRAEKDGPLQKMGHYMAVRLAERHGADQLREYSNGGAIAFFDDYVNLNVPFEYRFSDGVKNIVRNWRISWDSTNMREVRGIRITKSTDFANLGADLRKRFGGKSVYPNFSRQLVDLLEPMAIAGENEKVLTAAQLAVDLYPNMEPAVSNYGFFLVLYGRSKEGVEYLKRGAAMSSSGLAGVSGLNGIVKDVVAFGLFEQGMSVLEAAFVVHPKSAVLRETAARLFLQKGEKEKALFNFQKALEVEPGYSNAAAIRSEIEKLQ